MFLPWLVAEVPHAVGRRKDLWGIWLSRASPANTTVCRRAA